MSNPVASIINPHNKSETLLFTVSGQKAQPAMAVHPLDKKMAVTPYVDNGVLMGNVAVPGGLAVVSLRGLITVYGFTNASASGDQPAAKDTEAGAPKTNVLSQLIPFPNPLSKSDELQTPFVGLAAASNGEETAWVYFMKQGAKGKSPTLREAELVTGEEPELKSLGATLNPTSRLATLYLGGDKEERLVVFQTEEEDLKPLQFIKVTKKAKTDAKTITGTAIAANGTPLALSYHDREDKQRVIYLYFVTEPGELYRTHLIGNEWSTPESIGNDAVLLGSHLTVTTDSKHNHVFFIEQANPKKGYMNHRDPLVLS